MAGHDDFLDLNKYGSFREGLTRDIRFSEGSGTSTRHGREGKIGSGKSYQGKRALVLAAGAATEAYGKHGHLRNTMVSNPKDRLRISKKKLKGGPGQGLTRRESMRRDMVGWRDNHGGMLHADTVRAAEEWNNAATKSSSSKYNVNLSLIHI